MRHQRRPEPDRRGTNLKWAGCAACGKYSYPSRKAAKTRARQLYPGETMRVYRCGDAWHMTSTSTADTTYYREHVR